MGTMVFAILNAPVPNGGFVPLLIIAPERINAFRPIVGKKQSAQIRVADEFDASDGEYYLVLASV